MNVRELLIRPYLRFLDGASRTAVNNARRAMTQIQLDADDRRQLTAGLAPSAAMPGDEPAATTAIDPNSPGLVSLPTSECRALLAERQLGRLAFNNRAGQPLILPVNYVLDGRDILISSGPGPKLQAAERSEHVALEVDDIDHATHEGWSVLITGRAERVRLPSGAKKVPTWAPGPRNQLIRVRVDRLSGRRLRQT